MSIRLTVWLFVYCLVFAAGASARAIEMKVVSESGTPLANATITLLRIGGTTKLVTSSKTDLKGVIASEVAEGDSWKVCAYSDAPKLLDSCLWENELGIDAPVQSGTTKATKSITLHAGTNLKFQVSDPDGVLADSAVVQIGVFTTAGRYYQASVTNANAKIWEYELLVPNGLTFFLSVQSFGATVESDPGTPRVGDARHVPEVFTSDAKEASKIRRYTVHARAR